MARDANLFCHIVADEDRAPIARRAVAVVARICGSAPRASVGTSS